MEVSIQITLAILSVMTMFTQEILGSARTCFYCQGQNCYYYRDKPKLMKCPKSENTSYVCMFMEIRIERKDIIKNISNHLNVSFNTLGTFTSARCIAESAHIYLVCDKLDQEDGCACVLCTRDACNWHRSGVRRNTFSPLIFFANFFLLIIGVIE